MFNLSTEQARDMYLAELEERYPECPVNRLKAMVPEFPEGSDEYVVYRNRVRRALEKENAFMRLVES